MTILTPKRVLLSLAASVLLCGTARWLGWRPHLPKALVAERKVYVTNWANAEERVTPEMWRTNYTLCVSTGYCRWVFLVTNKTDAVEIVRKQ